MKNKDYQKLFKHDEADYIRRIMEECSELSVAVSHWHSGKIETKEVIVELADVKLQIDKTIAMISYFDKLQNNENENITSQVNNLYLGKKWQLSLITDNLC